MNSFEELDKKIQNYKNKHIKSPTNIDESKQPGTFVITELIASIGIGAFIGYYLDQYFHTKALFLFIFIILGLISSLYNIYRKLK